jgi:hypothetical protein
VDIADGILDAKDVFVLKVREAQQCLKNIKDLEVTQIKINIL